MAIPSTLQAGGQITRQTQSQTQERTHGGNIWALARERGCAPQDILDFSASINPLGPPAWLAEVIRENIPDLRHYPDPDCSELIQAASQYYGVPTDELVADNGTAEILHRLPPLLHGDAGPRRAVIPMPAYADYASVCANHGVHVEHLPMQRQDDFALDWDQLRDILKKPTRRPNLVFLGQPNNPTGRTLDPERLRSLAADHPETWFIVDEAFADFISGLDRLAVRRPPNMIVLLSLTKFYALPGLRIGLAAMDARLAEQYRNRSPDWSVNALAQCVGKRCLQDNPFQEASRTYIREERQRISAALSAVPGLQVFAGEANFLLCRCIRASYDARILAELLLQRRIAIRNCANFPGLDHTYFRIAVRRTEENHRLLGALTEVLGGAAHFIPPPRSQKRPTPALMFQGTCSNAGKSLLTAALCRILRQDGFSPAPFKAQNMALNSGVTPDGGEIGRAQILQAQASGLEPDRRMNPILLKPNSETGSQVIVLGTPQGNMNVGTYIRAKTELRNVVHEAYDSLSSEHDVMVLEGAGSPAEINLKHHDLVNMTMARHAEAAVFLVGDIDRGGVFAALKGTMDLLDDWERELVQGLIVNKFRGQRALLNPALDWITQRTQRPVLGVVPHLADLVLPEEDSVNFKQGTLYRQGQEGEAGHPRLDVACLDLPHISNFTDLDPLAAEPSVILRLVRSSDELGIPDLLILPGSKNVMTDMAFVRERGLVEAIRHLADTGSTHILGICGGFQMLGRLIEDPHSLESTRMASIPGLDLLPVTTRLESTKTLRLTAARHKPSDLEISGYEIHHGWTVPKSDREALAVCVESPDGRALGLGRMDKPVWGSYLHGIFDNDGFRQWLLSGVASAKRKSFQAAAGAWNIESELDRLADHVRQNLDIRAIYKILGVC
ncbi:MAG: cobyric acid synthase [Desulfovibrionales bacterium]|nr:MAG: cobyric acid synthase [Desulfovibrionales bacterium]